MSSCFRQVLNKPGFTASEDGQRLEILDLESRGIGLNFFISFVTKQYNNNTNIIQMGFRRQSDR